MQVIESMELSKRTMLTVLIYEELEYYEVAEILGISELEIMMAHKTLMEELGKSISPIPGLPMIVRENIN